MKQALFPISADPLTYGHLNVIEKALTLCDDSLIIVLLDNYYKKSSLPLPKRLALTKKAIDYHFTTADTPHFAMNRSSQPLVKKIELVSWDGFLHDFMIERNIFTVIRGLRTTQDLSYERTIYSGYETQLKPLGLKPNVIYIMCDRTYQDISSSLVKKLALRGGTLTSLVPLPIKQSLEQTLRHQYKLIVTGSMGSGKSTLIPKLIANLKKANIEAHHIDMDSIVATLYEMIAQGEKPMLNQQLATYFSLKTPFSKQDIRKIIFAPNRPNPKKDLQFLQQTLAPYIHSAYKQIIATQQGLLLIEAPQVIEYDLLKESNGFVLNVHCSETERKKRLLQTRDLSKTELANREALTLSAKERLGLLKKSLSALNHGHLFSYDNSTPHAFTELSNLAKTIISKLNLKAISTERL
ncbi:phosphopantetheine adenylyltransferase [Spirochaetota bacterium]|nr:phosphopantetheine adenylyltransferase [Spirochaetota bacterium]